ncbi:MAG: hypothetical protein LUH51_03875 [Firmicutes bacterium]|nr:hypothetical protein [Bacillota bacterium]
MVKGISKQVVVVNAPEEKLFEQAIFILKDGASAVSEEELLRQARRAVRNPGPGRRKLWLYGPAWACLGAGLTGLIWLLTSLL